jgi:hypothetical protein
VSVGLREFAGSVLRRWYVLVFVVGLALAAFALLLRGGGVYVAQPIIEFRLPGSDAVSAVNGVENDTVIAFAVTVAQSVNNGHAVVKYASDDAPPYGAGVRQGVTIAVPNVGGQWNVSYTRAQIAVTVVGATAQWVHATEDALLDRVVAASTALQQRENVPDSGRIESTVLPLSTDVQYISASRTQQALAASALIIAGLVTGSWLSVLLDRLVEWRHMRVKTPRPGTGRPSTKKEEYV